MKRELEANGFCDDRCGWRHSMIVPRAVWDLKDVCLDFKPSPGAQKLLEECYSKMFSNFKYYLTD